MVAYQCAICLSAVIISFFPKRLLVLFHIATTINTDVIQITTCVSFSYRYFLISSSTCEQLVRFYLQEPSGQAVVTGVFPSSPPSTI